MLASWEVTEEHGKRQGDVCRTRPIAAVEEYKAKFNTGEASVSDTATTLCCCATASSGLPREYGRRPLATGWQGAEEGSVARGSPLSTLFGARNSEAYLLEMPIKGCCSEIVKSAKKSWNSRKARLS